MLRMHFFHKKGIGSACLLIAFIAFSSCKKELKETNKVYEDELRDTSKLTLSISDTMGVNCGSYFTPAFGAEKKESVIKFWAMGYSGRALGRFDLFDLAPELQEAGSYSIKLRFKGEFDPHNHRFGTGPIIRLAHEKVLRYDPSLDKVIERQLKAPKSLSFLVDRTLSNYQVRMDGERNVTEFFKLEEGGHSDKMVLTVGAEGGSNRPGNCDTSSLKLDAVEVYVR